MQAVRYRLRFITGVALTSRTYGAATYSDGTYGETASDALSALVYVLVPWPAGHLPDPAWMYRQGDTTPQFKAYIASTLGPLDLDGVATAQLSLTNTDGGSIPLSFDLTVTPSGGIDWLVRNWLPHDLAVPGTYRAAVVLTYTSTRRLTVQVDDRIHFVINPNTIIPPPGEWDGSRWDEALWEDPP